MKTAIFDIDGTLSNANWRLHFVRPPEGTPKDYEAFHKRCMGDTVIEPVRAMVHALAFHNHKIVLITGRPETYGDLTVAWLDENDVPFDELHMRKAGSNERAVTYKHGVLQDLIARGHDIRLAVEDQQEVVDMWRANGIHCLQTQAVQQ